jgi:ankyrin repeat protein
MNDVHGYGQLAIHIAAEKGRLDVLTYLVNLGADVNAVTNEGILPEYTPLALAAKNGHMECAKFLVEKGANIKGMPDTISPLSCAVKHEQNSMADWLCSLGAQ